MRRDLGLETACVTDPCALTFGVYADWLEEHQEKYAVERIREAEVTADGFIEAWSRYIRRDIDRNKTWMDVAPRAWLRPSRDRIEVSQEMHSALCQRALRMSDYVGLDLAKIDDVLYCHRLPVVVGERVSLCSA